MLRGASCKNTVSMRSLGLSILMRPGGNYLDKRYPSLSRSVSEETSREIDAAVLELINTCCIRARTALENNKEILESSAGTLLEKETLDENDLA